MAPKKFEFENFFFSFLMKRQRDDKSFKLNSSGKWRKERTNEDSCRNGTNRVTAFPFCQVRPAPPGARSCCALVALRTSSRTSKKMGENVKAILPGGFSPLLIYINLFPPVSFVQEKKKGARDPYRGCFIIITSVWVKSSESRPPKKRKRSRIFHRYSNKLDLL